MRGALILNPLAGVRQDNPKKQVTSHGTAARAPNLCCLLLTAGVSRQPVTLILEGVSGFCAEL